MKIQNTFRERVFVVVAHPGCRDARNPGCVFSRTDFVHRCAVVRFCVCHLYLSFISICDFFDFFDVLRKVFIGKE